MSKGSRKDIRPTLLASLLLLAFFGLLMGGFHLLGILELTGRTAHIVGGSFVGAAFVVAYSGFRYDIVNNKK